MGNIFYNGHNYSGVNCGGILPTNNLGNYAGCSFNITYSFLCIQMIRITIELYPPLLTGKRMETIAKAIIINDGTGTKKRGNYKYNLWLKRNKPPWKKGTIKNFPRESYNVYELIKRVLNEI